MLGVVWLIGMTNAFNLLDNMDGLAATLAAIACAFFAIDAFTVHPSHLIATLSLGICLACIGFLPYNLRLRGPAAVFMGDSGAQVLGFALAALGLASSWTVAGSTVATLLLPIIVLAVPILDTSLVTIVRLLEGRPVTRGGRDHTSHRLVYQGLSDKRAVVLLCVVSAALGLTSLAYKVLDDTRITLVGVLITFAFLLQFGSYLAGVESLPEADGTKSFIRSLLVHRRRFVEVLVDFALITASFTVAYMIRVEGPGLPWWRHVFNLLAAGDPRRPLRHVRRSSASTEACGATRARAMRSSIFTAVVLSEGAAFLFIWATVPWNQFPRGTYLIDVLLCSLLIGIVPLLGARACTCDSRARGARRARAHVDRRRRTKRAEPAARAARDRRRARGRIRRRRSAVPAPPHPGRPGRREPRGDRLGDRPAVAGGGARHDSRRRRDRLDVVIEACRRGDVPCRFVRRQIDLDPAAVLGVVAE